MQNFYTAEQAAEITFEDALEEALEENLVHTTNGAVEFVSAGTGALDAFFGLGALRAATRRPETQALHAITLLQHVVDEGDYDRAVRLAYWARSPRDGAGERHVGRSLIASLFAAAPEAVTNRAVLAVARYGYWKDLAILAQTENMPQQVVDKIISAWAYAITAAVLTDASDEDKTTGRLAAKWAPRLGSKYDEVAKALRDALGLTNKEYRKLLKGLTEVVEQQMAAGEFGAIDFSSVPSVAGVRYREAFLRRDAERYTEWVESKDTKANASVLFPHLVTGLALKASTPVDVAFADKLWDALPDYVAPGERILPMIDVSGSMAVPADTKHSCMDVAVGIGLYVAERQEGPFKGAYLTFHESPRIMRTPEGTLADKVKACRAAPWGGSTNIAKAFDQVLQVALDFGVPEDQMPTMMLVLSDMQFDAAQYGKQGARPMLETIRTKYEAAGYTAPKLVFWNLHDTGGVPATKDHDGVALVSGYSPKVMEAVLAAEAFDPASIMDEALKGIDVPSLLQGPVRLPTGVVPETWSSSPSPSYSGW